MAYDRRSCIEIDRMRDKSGKRKKREKKDHEIRGHSTRYDKYKQDLNRLFDQGLAGELLKKPEKEPKEEPELPAAKGKGKAKSKAAVVTRKAKEGRIPKNSQASTNRLKLFRSVVLVGAGIVVLGVIGRTGTVLAGAGIDCGCPPEDPCNFIQTAVTAGPLIPNCRFVSTCRRSRRVLE